MVSFDPAERSSLHLVGSDGKSEPHGEAALKLRPVENVWMELLCDGLAFDLEGLRPGPGCEFPEFEHRFDLNGVSLDSSFEVLRLIPGPHLAGGENTLPIMRGMVGLARDIVHHFDGVVAVVWPPSKSAVGRVFFESVATAWLDGGPFPALGLTAFRQTSDGALQSEGLDYLIGQELRIEAPLSNDKVAATRLGVRLINQLVIVGGLDESERIVAPDGSRLIMRPSRNRRFVRVWRE